MLVATLRTTARYEQRFASQRTAHLAIVAKVKLHSTLPHEQTGLHEQIGLHEPIGFSCKRLV